MVLYVIALTTYCVVLELDRCLLSISAAPPVLSELVLEGDSLLLEELQQSDIYKFTKNLKDAFLQQLL